MLDASNDQHKHYRNRDIFLCEWHSGCADLLVCVSASHRSIDSTVGIAVLLSVSEMHWRGDLLACFGGLLLTGTSFLVEKLWLRSPHDKTLSLRAIFGIELLTMTIETLLYALLFDHWQSVHFIFPQDMFTFAYIGLATTLLPMVTMMVMRRYVNGVLLTFLGTLEPVAGAIFAFCFADERFAPLVYLGGALAIGSLVLQTWASRAGGVNKKQRRKQPYQKEVRFHAYNARMHLARPYWPQGRYTQLLLASLLSMSEGINLSTLHRLTGIPYDYMYRFLEVLQKRGLILYYQDSCKTKYYMLHPSCYVSKNLIAGFNL